MKVFFDTNVYVAEALLGETAEQMIEATARASWRIITSTYHHSAACNRIRQNSGSGSPEFWRIRLLGALWDYLLDEFQRVLVDELGFGRRLAFLSRARIVRRAALIDPAESRHVVPEDPKDNAILRAALQAGADYLVTNDAHLLALNPYQSLRIISMSKYHQLLVERGLLA